MGGIKYGTEERVGSRIWERENAEARVPWAESGALAAAANLSEGLMRLSRAITGCGECSN